MRAFSPATVPAPLARYSHGVEVEAQARLVFCSGQLGIAADATIPDEAEAQTELIFDTIAAILSEAGMGLGDLVRLNAYVSSREHIASYMVVRDRRVSLPPPASTLIVVTGFAREAFKVEIEAIAAKT